MIRDEYAKAFEKSYGATRRFLLGRGALPQDAEEIAQAAWARGWEFRDQLRDRALVVYWVNSIARNMFRSKFRTPVTAPLEGVNPGYFMDLDAIEVQRLLERCSIRDRELLLKSLEGYSAQEMARTEGITSTGIRVRLLRIRRSLRDRMTPVTA